jgi:putative ABC transport system permease protein
MARGLSPARLRPRDVLRVGGSGLRTQPLRVFLSALGIAIGIATMTAAVGISSSSQAQLDGRLAALGTDLLTVAPGTSMTTGETATLPDESVPMISRIRSVNRVAAVGRMPGTTVYRTDRVPATQTGGRTVRAAGLDLPGAVGASLADGTWFNAATARYPAVVLGSWAAAQLGIGAAGPEVQVYLGGRWFTVIGILAPMPLAPELDLTAFVGWPAAQSYLDFDGHPTTIYIRSQDSAVQAVRSVLAATANPQDPTGVEVSRPSDALAARQATSNAFTGLLVGLGAVVLVASGVGVANTMVISVLERRAEIGLRRSLGATRGQIRLQFLVESLLLSVLGGAGGVVLGIAVTAGYTRAWWWPTVVPVWAMAAGVAATAILGTIAGVYPAIRAARLSPTEALVAH